jgi:16S rRNA (uracil1498-N3)-methyltransferase
MRESRIYIPPRDRKGDRTEIRGDQAHHLVSVLRKKPGDDITVFDGEGTEALATIERIDHDLVVARIRRKEVHDKPNRPEVQLFSAVPKGRKFDIIVEAATELAADSITPLATTRSVVKLDSHNVEAKLERWRRIAIAAAKQCRRSVLPTINPPVEFALAVCDLPESVFPILMCSLGSSPPAWDVLRDGVASHAAIRVFIGPEGGFTPQEMEIAGNASVSFASLGENILRTETAAAASLAVVGCYLDSQSPRPPRDRDRVTE